MKHSSRHFLRLILGLVLFGWGLMPLRADDLAAGRLLLLEATPFEGMSIDAGQIDGKPVIVTFFASWCPPCTDEFKVLNQVRSSHAEERLGIIAVNAFEAWGGAKNPARMKRFLVRTKPDFTLVEETEGVLAAFGDVTRIPTLIIYDRNGREVWRFVHEVGAEKMSATLEDISGRAVRPRTSVSFACRRMRFWPPLPWWLDI